MAAGKGEPKTSPRRITAAARRKRAVELRIMGLTFEQIAAAPTSDTDARPLYPTNGRQRAHEAVMTEMAELAKSTRGMTAELRQIELARLDQLQVSMWPSTRPTRRVECPECHHVLWREPDQGATQTVLRIMERRAKYEGLDASDEADGRMVSLMEQQAALAHRAMVGAMDRAGISPEKQREVLEHAADIFREVEEAGE
jgi:hypothetical protein